MFQRERYWECIRATGRERERRQERELSGDDDDDYEELPPAKNFLRRESDWERRQERRWRSLQVSQAFKKYNEGNVMEMVDSIMQKVVHIEILMKMFGLALQCAVPTRSDRPDMKSVGEEFCRIRMGIRRGRKVSFVRVQSEAFFFTFPKSNVFQNFHLYSNPRF